MRRYRSSFAIITAMLLLITSILPSAEIVFAESAKEHDGLKARSNIKHESPAYIDASDDFQVVLNRVQAEAVTLYYRTNEWMKPVSIEMEEVDAANYRALILQSALWSTQIEYWFEVEKEEVITKTSVYQVDVRKQETEDTQLIPKLLITEADLEHETYPFIEIYNNTNKTLELENYELKIGEQPINLSDTLELTIASQETKVVWFVNDENASMDRQDFNEHYASNLTDSDLLLTKKALQSTEELRITMTDKKTNKEEVIAPYTQGEESASQLYYYSNESNRMNEGGAGIHIQPGTLQPGQVPHTAVLVEDRLQDKTELENESGEKTEEEDAPQHDEEPALLDIVHEPVTEIDGGRDLRLEASVPNAKKVILQYQTGDKMEWKSVELTGESDSNKLIATVPSEAFWSPVFHYKIIAEADDGSVTKYPEEGAVTAEVKQEQDIDTQKLPTLLITEITPDTVNVNKADAYEFIEIYNNTNQRINMRDYNLIYRYPAGSSSADQSWDLTEDKWIASQESFIVWIHNDGNKDLSLADFNEQYGLALTEDKVTIIKSDGMANGTERTIVVTDNFNNEIVQATYNDGQKDVQADQGIVYAYPSEGKAMKKVGVGETVTPLTVIAGQTPKQAVQVNDADSQISIEHEQPIISDSQQDIELKVKVIAEKTEDILGVNAYVKQSDSMDYENIELLETDEAGIYTVTIPRELIWNAHMSYYFETSVQKQTVTTDVYELKMPQQEVNYQEVPELFITELVPDSTNVNGLDGYEFIEVYNNSAQAIDFSNYTIRYRYPMEGPAADFFWGPTEEEEVIIPSGETVVFWIINSGNTAKEAQDFNRNYGSNLQEGKDLFKIYNGGMSNSAHRSLVIATKSGHEISEVNYYEEVNVDDTIADKGIFYRYPTDGTTRLTKISAGSLDATPGTIIPEQVPPEKVNKVQDQAHPVIKDLTGKQQATAREPLKISAEITDNHIVKKATLHYKLSGYEEFVKVNVMFNDNNEYRHTIYEPDLIGRESIQYYFTATDGMNEVTTDINIIEIEQAEGQEGLRLNLEKDEVVAGERIIKATSEQPPENLSLKIDGKEVSDTFVALETEAYFAFDVRKTNLYFKNGVTIGDETLHIFDDTINEYTTLTVPIDADKLQIGENVISIRAGTKVSPFDEGSPENRDDFNVKNVRLVLSDGTTIYDPNYASKQEELLLGDNGSSIPVIDFTFMLEEESFTSLAHLLDSTTLTDGDHKVTTTLQEESVEGTIVVDNTAPVIQTNVEVDKLYKGKFTIDAEVTDAMSGVEKVTAQLDGEYITLPYETSSALLEAGSHDVIVTATDYAGNETREQVTFATVEEQPLSPEGLDDTVEDTSASLSVRVSDPTNDVLDVSFYEAYQYTAADTENLVMSHHAVDTEPPQSYQPDGETAFTKEEIENVTKFDGEAVGTDSSTQFPYHRFDVTVDEKVKPSDEVEIVWKGSSLPGRKVTMYAWNFETEKWVDLVSTVAGEEAFELVGFTSGEAYIQDQKISVIVQDQIEKSEDDFTFVWMSDTQYYSQSYPHIYERQVDWIAEKQEELNIQYVFHTGDLVDDSEDFTQWNVADESMKVLDDKQIPYGVLAGNHDVGHKDGQYDNYYKYFGADRFIDRPYYGGTYLNNRGHYDLISASGNDFIMIYMGWGVDQAGIDWMNEVLEKYPNRKAFINVHEYLLASGTRSPIGEEIFQKVVVPNENVYAVLAGHYHNSQKVIDEIDDDNDGVADRTVYQLLANYQGGPEGGQGFMRLFNFNTETNEIDVQTYSPYLDKYNYYDPSVEPGKDEFNIPWDTSAEVKRVATDYIEVNVYTDELIGDVKDVPSGEVATVVWEGLSPNGKYDWYVIAKDDYGAEKRSMIWSFYTEDGRVIEPEPDPSPEPNPNPNPNPEPGPESPSVPELDDEPSIEHPGNLGHSPNNKEEAVDPPPYFENTRDKGEKSEGSPLPKTGTNNYNYLLFGVLFILVSIYVLRHRRFNMMKK